jgi:putative ABC transport system permease protein
MTTAGLAWGNLIQRPWRTAILVVCIACLVGMQLAATIIDHASRQGLKLGLQRLGADLVAVPRQLDSTLVQAYMTGKAAVFYMPGLFEQRIQDLEFVKQTSPQLYIESLSNAACCSSWNVFLIGFDPQTDFTVRPWLNKHRDIQLGPADILVGAAIQSFPGMAYKFYGQTFTVAGTLDSIGMGLDYSVFIPMAGVKRMIAESGTKAEKRLNIAPDQISAVLIKLKSEGFGGLPGWKAAYEIERLIPEITIIRPSDITIKVQNNLSGTLKTLTVASFAIWPMTVLLVGLVFMMVVHERQREIGLMRAMGSTRLFIFRMIQIEALMISTLGAVLGLIVSSGIVISFERMIALKLEIPFTIPGNFELLGIAAFSFGLAVITGILAAMIPALRVSAMEPYEAIRRAG